MKTTVVLLVLGLCLAACGEEPDPPASTSLRFDGVYRCMSHPDGSDPVWLYMRFYPDGLVVVGAAVHAEPWQLEHWLDRNCEYRGQYVLRDDRVTFTCTGPGVATEYDGRLLPDGLSVSWDSSTTGNSGSDEYRFVRMTSGMEAPWGGPVAPEQLQALRDLGVPMAQVGLMYEYEGNPAQGGMQTAEIGLTPNGRATVYSMYDSGWGTLRRRFLGRWRVDGAMLLLEVRQRDGGDPVTLVTLVREAHLMFNDREVEGHGLREGDPRLREVLPDADDSDSVVLRLVTPLAGAEKRGE